MIEVRNTKIGVVSATTVNGDFVNDNLPTADELWRKHLDSHDASEPLVAGLVDLAHPARADRGLDFIRAESGAGGEGHR